MLLIVFTMALVDRSWSWHNYSDKNKHVCPGPGSGPGPGCGVFSRSGEASGCSINTSITNKLINTWFVDKSLRRHHALVGKDGAFNHKIDYVSIFKGN